MTTTSIHDKPHPMAGRTVALSPNVQDYTDRLHPGDEFRVEDYWDRIAGRSWQVSDGNPAAMSYGMRIGFGQHVDMGNEVVYGKDKSGLGHLVHCDELGGPIS